MFKNPEKLQEALIEEVRSRDLGISFEEALELIDVRDEDGNVKKEFKLPLFHPLHSERNESMLNSFFTNRVIKQRSKGASLVNMSDFGVEQSSKLDVVLNEETGNVEYVEALLPWWSKKFFPVKEDGTPDLDKISPELLESVGYRIPTEDKYSMFPVKVVGFTPKEMGGVVVLPSEVTRIAGLDFDIDKLFFMFYEWEKRDGKYVKAEYNLDTTEEAVKARYDKYKQRVLRGKEAVALAKEFGFNVQEISALNDAIKNSDELEEKLAGILGDISIEDVLIEEGKMKSLEEFSSLSVVNQNPKKSTNNFRLDIIRGILTDPNHFEQFINPGGFDTLKSLKDKVNKLLGKEGSEMNPVLPSAQTEYFVRNMAGKDLIGIFANHNANHSMTQHTDVSFKFNIKFNGENRKDLSGKYTADTETRISRILAEFLAASVDNAKDPVLSDLNVNTYTADIIASIIRVGYPLETAMMFINQPIIREVTEAYYNSGATPWSSASSISNHRQKMVDILKGSMKEDELNALMEAISRGSYTLDDKSLVENFGNKDNKEKQKEYAVSQLKVLNHFKWLELQGKDLSTLVRSMRADSVGAGPTIADNEVFLSTVNIASTSKDFLIENVDTIFDRGESTYKSVAAFTDTVRQANRTLTDIFPWTNRLFSNVKQDLQRIKGEPLTVKEIRFVNYNLLSFVASRSPQMQISEEDYVYLTTKFPKKFHALKSASAALRENPFTKRLNLFPGEKGKLDSIEFSNVGKLTSVQKDTIIGGFKELLNDEATRDIAEDLIRYNMATSGFLFTPKSFTHLIPVDYYVQLDGFNQYLQQAVANNDFKDEFVEQFYRNHYKRFRFVPSIPKAWVKEKKTDKSLPTPDVLEIDNEKASGILPNVVTYTSDKQQYLYSLSRSRSDNKLKYFLVDPLGKGTQATEWKLPDESDSVFDENILTGNHLISFSGEFLAENPEENLENPDESSTFVDDDTDNLPDCI